MTLVMSVCLVQDSFPDLVAAIIITIMIMMMHIRLLPSKHGITKVPL